jgi:hypothetical protein
MRCSPRVLGALAFLLGSVFVGPAPGSAADPPRIAVFDFELINTSPMPSTAEELARTRRLGDQLRAALAQSGAYQVVDTAPVREELERAGGSIRNCNGCELALAQKLGASEVAFGWVQKVSNLILNINLVIEDAASGKPLKSGSVDIRGNTDESWSRGLKFLLEEHIRN